jgi:hypothetical protein
MVNIIKANTSGGANNLGLPVQSTPLVDVKTGLVTSRWWPFFNNLYDRVGGVDAPSNSQLSEDFTNLTTAVAISIDGEDGEDGLPGDTGPTGPPGSPGSAGFSSIEEEDAVDVLTEALSLQQVIPIFNFNVVTATQGTPQTLTTATALDIISITLEQGQYDVFGSVYLIPNVTTTVTAGGAGISDTSATLPVIPDYTYYGFPFPTGGETVFPVPTIQVNVPFGGATMYLVANFAFTGGTCAVQGKITARRYN